MQPTDSPLISRRSALCCGTLLFAGLLASDKADAISLADGVRNPCPPPEPLSTWGKEEVALLTKAFDGIDFSQYIDVHAHLLGTGDSGSGCFVHPLLYQLWRPIEVLRRKSILNGACVIEAKGEIDRQYVGVMARLMNDFPAGARCSLFAFERAYESSGRPDDTNSTFHVPNAYAQQQASSSDRFEWVASVHPYREDAIDALTTAKRNGAIALKWLPSAMNIDWRDKRCLPIYDWLAKEKMPLISHFGEEKAVPGARQHDFVNPLYARVALDRGVRLVMAHCASLGSAQDIDSSSKKKAACFDLFSRLMNEKAYEKLLFADISAVFQANRSAEIGHRLLRETAWHGRLLQGSDYPLPGVWPLYDVDALVATGLLDESAAAPLKAIRRRNALLFDFALKRSIRSQQRGFERGVFETRGFFSGQSTYGFSN